MFSIVIVHCVSLSGGLSWKSYPVRLLSDSAISPDATVRRHYRPNPGKNEKPSLSGCVPILHNYVRVKLGLTLSVLTRPAAAITWTPTGVGRRHKTGLW